MRPGGKDGYIYGMTFGAQVIEAGSLTAGEWYRIDAKGAATTLPSALEVGEGFICPAAGIVLAADDKATPITISKLAFVTDDEDSSSKQKYEDTVQVDEVRSYQQGKKPEITGSVSGYYETDSAEAEEIENKFKVIIKDDGAGNITRKVLDGNEFHTMISRRETTEVGETEVWEYKPMIVDQLSQGKPMDGNQPFKFNYTINGKFKPFVYKRVVPA